MKYGTTVEAAVPCVVVEVCVTGGLPAVVVTVTVRTDELPQPAQAATTSRKSAKRLI
jgi:hypothetical protein